MADELKAASENLTAKTDALKALVATRETLGKQIEDAKAEVEAAKEQFAKAALDVQQEAHDLVIAS
jgi:seryl-tRNA synthetase